MMRWIYQGLLWLHPPAFRQQFAGEMLWIFDEASSARGVVPLFADGVISLGRQWLLRSGMWKVAVAGIGGLFEISLAIPMVFPSLWGPCHVRAALAEMAADAARVRFAGNWTGTLRSTGPSGRIELTLTKHGARWIGELHIQGNDGQMHAGPAEDIRVGSDSLRFRVAAGDADMTFNGEFRDGRLVGNLEATAKSMNQPSGRKGRRIGQGTWELIPAKPRDGPEALHAGRQQA